MKAVRFLLSPWSRPPAVTLYVVGESCCRPGPSFSCLFWDHGIDSAVIVSPGRRIPGADMSSYVSIMVVLVEFVSQCRGMMRVKTDHSVV